MKFKLDENFSKKIQNIFEDFGYDAETVPQELLSGCDDEKIYQVCCNENFCLVTLEKDFGDVSRFDPKDLGGIAIIRPPKNPSINTIEILIKQFLNYLKKEPIEKRLWIIEIGRIRIHQSTINDEE